MRRVVSGGEEIDTCAACGALWFDLGEIRELTAGRLTAAEGPGEGSSAITATGAGTIGKSGSALSMMHSSAVFLRCPRCEGRMSAVDFQATGIPVLHCPSCEGILAPRESAAAIHAKFRFMREHGTKFAALGETIAGETRRRMEAKLGPSGTSAHGGMPVPIPIVVPLADDAPESGALPLVTYALIAISVFLYLVGQVKGAPLPLPGGLAGLPSGTGFAGVPKLPLVFAPFFHAGFLPLAVGSFILFVLGDNVEDRMGMLSCLALYLLCGTFAGAAHVLWGKAGGPPAQGSAGAVAGVLGAYLVFFPNVSIRMYGMGRLVRLPAYLFACAWVVAAFLLDWNRNPVVEFLNPAALSLAGNLAGFGMGVLCAILWRFGENAVEEKRNPA